MKTAPKLPTADLHQSVSADRGRRMLLRYRFATSHAFVLLLICSGFCALPTLSRGQISEDVTTPKQALSDALTLFDLDVEKLSNITEDDPPDALFRGLEAVRRIPATTLLDCQQLNFDWRRDGPLKSPNVALLQGRLKNIQAIALPEPWRAKLGQQNGFRCVVQSDQSSDPLEVTCFALRAPQQLMDPTSQATNQRVRATALVASRANNNSNAIAITRRLAWHPDEGDAQLVYLSERGLDIGALAELRHNAPLHSGDGLAFYQLLALAKRWNENKLNEFAQKNALSLATMIKDPQRHTGNSVRLIGTARRAVPIYVEQEPLPSRLGIRRYYEIEVFVDADPPIKIQAANQDRVFQRYPVVFCATELPPDMPTGDEIHETVEITGVFLKNWAYPSGWLNAGSSDQQQLQVSPLLIGKAPRWLQPELSQPSFLELWAGWIFVAILVLIAFAVWRTSVGDQRQRRLRRRVTPPDFHQLGEGKE